MKITHLEIEKTTWGDVYKYVTKDTDYEDCSFGGIMKVEYPIIWIPVKNEQQ